MVALAQCTILRGGAHILEPHAGVVLLDHIVIRRKSDGVWKFGVHSQGPTQEKYFAFQMKTQP